MSNLASWSLMPKTMVMVWPILTMPETSDDQGPLPDWICIQHWRLSPRKLAVTAFSMFTWKQEVFREQVLRKLIFPLGQANETFLIRLLGSTLIEMNERLCIWRKSKVYTSTTPHWCTNVELVLCGCHIISTYMNVSTFNRIYLFPRHVNKHFNNVAVSCNSIFFKLTSSRSCLEKLGSFIV